MQNAMRQDTSGGNMRLLVCAAASVLLISDYALALDDTPTGPAYVSPREAVRAVAPPRRQAAAVLPAALSGKSPAPKRVPAIVLAEEKFRPPPCRALSCATAFPSRSRIGGPP